jgi:O-antigen/teichoic acid export membrane protein
VVAAINSILGGAGLALLAARLGLLGDGVAVGVGLVVALVLFGLYVVYQQRRSTQAGR